MFPALRVIEGGSLDWPTIPREIPGSHVAKWAEILHEKGIKLVDAQGQGWRPRVKTSRGG
ncbi:hypothetical protein AURDEDRAFT_166599 [Auricularia subglabra TFB-10046 SS5]|nr:hypothetical protein AURDEDRAFT_166599 [Auricularia subglabra TFB-10046 SS5]